MRRSFFQSLEKMGLGALVRGPVSGEFTLKSEMDRAAESNKVVISATGRSRGGSGIMDHSWLPQAKHWNANLIDRLSASIEQLQPTPTSLVPLHYGIILITKLFPQDKREQATARLVEYAALRRNFHVYGSATVQRKASAAAHAMIRSAAGNHDVHNTHLQKAAHKDLDLFILQNPIREATAFDDIDNIMTKARALSEDIASYQPLLAYPAHGSYIATGAIFLSWSPQVQQGRHVQLSINLGEKILFESGLIANSGRVRIPEPLVLPGVYTWTIDFPDNPLLTTTTSFVVAPDISDPVHASTEARLIDRGGNKLDVLIDLQLNTDAVDQTETVRFDYAVLDVTGGVVNAFPIITTAPYSRKQNKELRSQFSNTE